VINKCIGELNIVEINRELHKHGIDTGGSKVDRLLILEEFFCTRKRTDPRSLRFEVTGESSVLVPGGKTSEALSEED